jgi:hypothetical protein
MIKYALRCADGHDFDSWFASAGAYDALAEAGRLVCAVCGGSDVHKALMAPRVRPARKKAAPPAHDQAQKTNGAPGARAPAPAGHLSAPASELEAAIAEFRARVEASTEDVGGRFAEEARAIHEGRAPDRAIRGEAKIAEARALMEDGVPVLPLPFRPTRQVN